MEHTQSAVEAVPPGMRDIGAIHTYEVALVNCVVTKQMDKCICLPVGSFTSQGFDPATGEPLLDDDGKPKLVDFEVIAQFSAPALQQLLLMLEAAPFPVPMKTAEEVTHENPYGWLAVYPDGRRTYQYGPEGGETPFASIHIPDLSEFWIIPQSHSSGLPAYGFSPEMGFVIVKKPGGDIEPMHLPYFPGRPVWFQYRRKVTRNFLVGRGGSTENSYIKQTFGWRVEEPDGTRIVFEVGIEPNGRWSPFHKEPLDHPLFEGLIINNESAPAEEVGLGSFKE